jgi:hypothetical protein
MGNDRLEADGAPGHRDDGDRLKRENASMIIEKLRAGNPRRQSREEARAASRSRS